METLVLGVMAGLGLVVVGFVVFLAKKAAKKARENKKIDNIISKVEDVNNFKFKK